MAPYADRRPQRIGTFALDRRHSSPMPPYPDHLHPTDSHSTRVSCSSQADGIARGGTSVDSALHRIARLSPGADEPQPATHQTTTPPRTRHRPAGTASPPAPDPEASGLSAGTRGCCPPIHRTAYDSPAHPARVRPRTPHRHTPHSPRRVGRLATARRPAPLAPTVTDRAQGS